MTIIPMDRRVLSYLAENGPTHHSDIPARLFSGTVPQERRSLTDLGLVDDIDGTIAITQLGRDALVSA